MTITIRPAQPTDHEFILSLVPRFSSFDLPPGRTREQLDRANHQALTAKLTAQAAGTATMIAQDAVGVGLGFIHLQTKTDSFTGEPHGHISDIAVAADGEGRGVGQALMRAAEAWARQQGYQLLTLHVFASNMRARRFYAGLGWSEEILTCAKELPLLTGPAADPSD